MNRKMRLAASIAALLIASVVTVHADWNVAVNPTTTQPESVWTYPSEGQPTYLLYSRLDGEEWESPTTLGTAQDGSGAGIGFDADGGRSVAWCLDDQVVMRRKGAEDTSWNAQVAVSESSQVAASPSVAVHADDTFVSYEVIPESGARIVKVAKVDPGSGVERTLVATASTGAELHSLLHEEDDVLWVDWVDSGTELGFSVWSDGEWGKASYEAYTDSSDIPDARHRIRSSVLNP